MPHLGFGHLLWSVLLVYAMFTGTLIGVLNLDNLSSVVSVTESEPNSYFRLIRTDSGFGFEVSKKIDTDTGVDRHQIILLSCKNQLGVELEVRIANRLLPLFHRLPAFFHLSTILFPPFEDRPRTR